MPSAVLDVVTSGLAVSNLRLTNVSVNLELTKQTVDDDLEVQLAHAGDDGLAGLVVGGYLEGRVLLGELGQSRWTSSSCSALVLGSMATSITGLANSIFSRTISLPSAHRVSPVVVFLRPTQAMMSPAHAVVAVDTLGSVHLEDAAQTLALAIGSVDRRQEPDSATPE